MEYLGVAILTVLGYVATHFMAKPILAYRKLRAEIAKSLILYANVTAPPHGKDEERWNEAGKVYREQASTLIACANNIVPYSFWGKLHIIPCLEDIHTAKANLLGLSIGIGVQGEGLNNSKRRQTIERCLRIKTER